ncbi:MAG: AAA-like domain-containing protein [Eubacterium sp.]|nr:AAA-like domain-containing protein [Eubacterium sp.]
MERCFNTEGRCNPMEHYMVSLDSRLDSIKRLFVDRGKYFAINRGRQYGKTTMLMALAKYLQADYFVLATDFQLIGTEEFAEDAAFVRAFVRLLIKAVHRWDFPKDGKLKALLEELSDTSKKRTLGELFVLLSGICEHAYKPVVLLVDETDSASNNQVFIDFLSQLRGYYLDRENSPIFHSVILAGVYDIKNLKLKIRRESEHQYNSPWNIAADFDIDMSFSAEEISVMLEEYKKERKCGIDANKAAKEIYAYTFGYPYLVSAICKFLDESLPGRKGFETIESVWTKKGVVQAVDNLLKKRIPLFESMARQLDAYKDLHDVLEQIIYEGKRIPFSPAERAINLGMMFSYLKEENGRIVMANRMFEMYLLNLFITQESLKSQSFACGERDRNQFITGGRLNMELVLKKFVIHFHEIYGDSDEKFAEEYGRRFFLLYLKPIINGTGNYYLEAQTRDARRTDVIVDYAGEQFIIEMKIWHGNEYNERGRQQLSEYLDYYHQPKGYLLSFSFNQKKEPGVKRIQVGEKTIIEAVV